MKICAIIPSYNHAEVVGSIVERLRQAQLTVFIIDDGSQSPAREILAALHNEACGVFVHRLHVNQGKGDAVIKGFELASAASFTHAVQIDADGQHDLTTLPKMLALATRYPQALISGQPVYDDSISMGRKIGRWVTHVWVWVETLSLRITDSMCGFRVYPLAAVNTLLAEETVGRRMDFDTDIMVRLFWRGVSQTVIVTATLNEYVNRLKIDYRICDKITGEVLTKATTIQVALKADSSELCLECPADLTDKVKKLL